MAKIYSQLMLSLARTARYIRSKAPEDRMAVAAAVERIQARRRAERAQADLEQARRERAERFARKVVPLQRGTSSAAIPDSE